MAHKDEDYELVKNFLEGDDSSFNRLVSKYRQKIYWHARRMAGNHLDADEIVQEVLLVLYKKLNTFRFNSSLYTWIYKITSTRSINYLRRKNLRYFFSTEDNTVRDIGKTDDIIENIESREKFEKVMNLLQKLPPRQREVFILRNINEMSYDEISEITGTSIGSLKASNFHAVKKIADMMSKYE